MSVARFRVEGRNFDGSRMATVLIDRNTGFFFVRPLRRRKEYMLLLADVAEMVLWRCVRAEVAEKKRAKKLARRAA